MILTAEKKKMTREEFLELPYERKEYIDGIAYINEPAPTYSHQSNAARIAAQLFAHMTLSKNGEVLFAPIDVILGSNVTQPDLLFIANTNRSIVEEDGLHGAPDVVFEIISPSTAIRDTNRKFKIYEEHGVKEYFIVYPDDKTVIKYALESGKYHEQYRDVGLVQSECMQCEFTF
jgi:Uma2 family endonuclease